MSEQTKTESEVSQMREQLKDEIRELTARRELLDDSIEVLREKLWALRDKPEDS